ncbi:YdcF family protein [Aneurinibacillus migulanus]|uniref:Uncharacterized SAM-binding protein YcdF, DUF218 family n=2 Tax=Aneurinibacillus migulanus TaxID=47500 RepID=A0A1G8XMW1_ANEMI|nr:YdcF family protein [Aneurinibacillus migulanus]MED0894081.1 YdcF family protein [Aneurinibacillus migulanus]MED1616812.1 YdcF family protein [Aneurinibacillus migulanus]GED15801.1 hypothetical protein AMI01nite_37920 [Aneurinibacillus migulanus]SDJ91992.1 Uncharacterized SAM-binding protein YcdF, DUF218 family [Aneurinibacillus migulanus]
MWQTERVRVSEKRKSMRKRALTLIGVLLLLPICYVVGAHAAIMYTARQQPQPGSEYMIILGAALWGDKMSPSLQYRMDAGLAYLKHNPHTKVIVSGGQGVNEDFPEAVAMQKFLLANGIAAQRILVEDKARSTAENIRFSRPLMTSDQAVLVTNDFHTLRAKLLAERAGIKAQILAAPTPDSVKVKLFVREYVALIKSWWFD